MKQVHQGETKTRAVMPKPPLAMVAKADGPSAMSPQSTEPTREQRVRDAAYALYESRGCSPGHELEDWFAAEASVDR